MGDKEAADSDQDTPRMLCSMSLSPRVQRQPTSSRPSEGRAPAVIPYNTQLWRKEKLIVKLQNQQLLDEWGISEDKFRKCVNRWCPSTVNGEQNYIPTFEFDSECAEPDIIVKFNERGQNESDMGTRGNGNSSVVYLDLSDDDKTYREHLIVHEFGHALGLGHEHQRSDFWKFIKDFIDEDAMRKDLRERFVDWQDSIDTSTSSHTSYDRDSVMHYWFKASWLKDGYSNRDVIIQRENTLSDGTKAALYGVHERDGSLVTHPSFGDLKFLSNEYKKIRGEQVDRDNPPKASSASAVSASEGPPSLGGSDAKRQSREPLFTNTNLIMFILFLLASIVAGVIFLKPDTSPLFVVDKELKERHEDSVTVTSSPKPSPINSQHKSDHIMNPSDIPELTKIIRSHGSARQWCSFLQLNEGTCNVLDFSSQHPENVILDVAKAYLDQKLNPCWEDIVRILCNELNKQGAALKLSEKHGVDFSSQCN